MEWEIVDLKTGERKCRGVLSECTDFLIYGCTKEERDQFSLQLAEQ